jgi:hypothetical protein
MGVKVDHLSYVFGDNLGVIQNVTMKKDSLLKKKRVAISYHKTREATASGLTYPGKIANDSAAFQWDIDTICCFLCDCKNKKMAMTLEKFCVGCDDDLLPAGVQVSYKRTTAQITVQVILERQARRRPITT